MVCIVVEMRSNELPGLEGTFMIDEAPKPIDLGRAWELLWFLSLKMLRDPAD
jgi:hypothetical protein